MSLPGTKIKVQRSSASRRNVLEEASSIFVIEGALSICARDTVRRARTNMRGWLALATACMGGDEKLLASGDRLEHPIIGGESTKFVYTVVHVPGSLHGLVDPPSDARVQFGRHGSVGEVIHF